MIDCEEFLKKAQYIHESFSLKGYSYHCAEMDFRECARISYYYIFHKASLRANAIPGDFNTNTGSHQRVIDKLLSSKIEEDNELGKLMIRFRVVRVKADYGLKESFKKNDAYKVLRAAEKLFTTAI